LPWAANVRTPRAPYIRIRRSAWSVLFCGGEVDLAVEERRRPRLSRLDVEVEYLGGDCEGRAGVGDVHNAADSAFDGSRTQNRIRLCPGEAELLQVLDRIQ